MILFCLPGQDITALPCRARDCPDVQLLLPPGWRGQLKDRLAIYTAVGQLTRQGSFVVSLSCFFGSIIHLKNILGVYYIPGPAVGVGDEP